MAEICDAARGCGTKLYPLDLGAGGYLYVLLRIADPGAELYRYLVFSQ